MRSLPDVHDICNPAVPNRLLEDTLQAVLSPIVTELSEEIDLRATGFGRNVAVRSAIYLRALLRDVLRIPLHYSKGIGQAHFRHRISYISNTAIPTLRFFLDRYPLDENRRSLLENAIELLTCGESLISDGRFHKLDEWYATMEEFYRLTECSCAAAAKIREAVTSEYLADSNVLR